VPSEFRSLQGRFHGAGSACVTIPGSFPTKAPGVGRYVHHDVKSTGVTERDAGRRGADHAPADHVVRDVPFLSAVERPCASERRKPRWCLSWRCSFLSSGVLLHAAMAYLAYIASDGGCKGLQAGEEWARSNSGSGYIISAGGPGVGSAAGSKLTSACSRGVLLCLPFSLTLSLSPYRCRRG
jgi:hypothetical protein